MASIKRRRKQDSDVLPVKAINVISFRADRFVGNTPETSHPDMQMVMVLHGSAHLIYESGQVSLSSGDILCIRPGIKYRLADAQALQLVRCCLNPRILRRKLTDAFDAKALFILSRADPVSKYEVPLDRFRTIASLVGGTTAGGDMGNIGRTLLLLETIVEHGVSQVQKIHSAVLRAIQKFDEDIAKDWTLPEISEVLDLDPSYVARLFKSGLGIPPLAYLALLRAEEAALLLSISKLSCASVGDRVGWPDPNYFSRRFRQHFGESPTAFRDRALGAAA